MSEFIIHNAEQDDRYYALSWFYINIQGWVHMKISVFNANGDIG